MNPSSYGWVSVVPPLLAIGLAIATRQVILSLLAGVWIGWVIQAGGDPVAGTARALECLVGVFGDHCSPISDTTIVSSMASCCDHIDHVRTQMPYALLAGGASAIMYAIIGMFP